MKQTTGATRNVTLATLACAAFSFSASAEPAPRSIDVGYVPKEAQPINWVRDLGFSRLELVACKNLNSSAEWFDACQKLIGAPNTENFSLYFDESGKPGELAGARDAAIVEAITKNETVKIRFVQLPLAKFTLPKLKTDQNEIVRIVRDFKDRLLRCQVTESDAVRPSRKTWVLKKAGNTASQLLVEAETVSFNYLRGYDAAECQVVLYDGLLFKRFSATQNIEDVELSPNRISKPYSISVDDVSNFNLVPLLGPARPDEAFFCRQKNLDPFLPNICNLLDTATGLFNKAGKQEAFRKALVPIGSSLFSIQIGKVRDQKEVTSVTSKIFVDTRVTGGAPKDAQFDLKVAVLDQAPARVLECQDINTEPVQNPNSRYQWKVNGKEIKGWQYSWLHPHFVQFGSSYSCSQQNKHSDDFRIDADFLTLLGVTQVFLNSANAKQSFPIETNTSLGNVSSKWECFSDSPHLKCAVLGPDNTSRRLVEVTQASSATQANAAIQIKVSFENDGQPLGTLTKTVRVVSEPELRGSYLDDSSNLSLKKLEDGLFRCELRDEGDNVVVSRHWTVGGREASATRNQQTAQFPSLPVDSVVTCQTVHKRKGQLFTALAQFKVTPPLPKLDDVPNNLVIDLTKSSSAEFDYTDPATETLNVECALFAASGRQISQNLCASVPHTNREIDGQELRRFRIRTTLSEIKRIEKIVADENPRDPYYLNEYELRIRFFSNKRSILKKMRAQLIRPNSRPTVHFATSFTDNGGAPQCLFLISDPNNNHLTAKVTWPDFPGAEETFSTFPRPGKNELTRVKMGPVDSQLLLGVSRLKVQNPAQQKTRNMRVCEVLASDGTLISTKTSQLSASESAGYQMLENEIGKHPTSIKEEPSAVYEPAPFLNREPVFNNPIGLTLRSVKFTSSGRHRLDTGVTPLEIVSCFSNAEACKQFFINNGQLYVAVTSDLPSGIYSLVVRLADAQLHTLSFELHNDVFVGNKIASYDNCLHSLVLKQNKTLPDWLEVDFHAKYEDKRNIEIPFLALDAAKAVSLGASDVLCYTRFLSSSRTVLSTRVTSLRQAIAKELPAHPPVHSVTLALPEDGSFRLLELFSKRYGLKPALPRVLATSVKITNCIEVSGNTNLPCQVEAASLHVRLRSKRYTTIRISYSFNIAHARIDETLDVHFVAPSERIHNQLMSVKLLRTSDEDEKYACSVSGLSEARNGISFKIFIESKQIILHSGTERIFQFSLNEPLGDKTLLCDVDVDDGHEVAAYQKLSNVGKMQTTCYGLTKTAGIEQFECQIPRESILAMANDTHKLVELLPPAARDRYTMFKFVATADEAPIKISESWVATTATVLSSQPVQTDSVAYGLVEPWLGKFICYFDSVQKPSKNGDEGLAAKSSSDCLMLGRAPAALHPNKAFTDIYVAGLGASRRSMNEPIRPWEFATVEPDALEAASFQKSFYIERWSNNIRRLMFSEQKAVTKVYCEGPTSKSACHENADRLVTRFRNSKADLDLSVERGTDVMEASRQSSALKIKVEYANPNREYYSTLAEFYRF